MQRVGRPLEHTIIIDNSPNSYQFQPENGIPILSWYDDPEDRELMAFVPGLKLLANELIEDVRPIIIQSVIDNEWYPETCENLCKTIIAQRKSEARKQPISISLETEEKHQPKVNKLFDAEDDHVPLNSSGGKQPK